MEEKELLGRGVGSNFALSMEPSRRHETKVSAAKEGTRTTSGNTIKGLSRRNLNADFVGTQKKRRTPSSTESRSCGFELFGSIRLKNLN